jgi:hypothetical protein
MTASPRSIARRCAAGAIATVVWPADVLGYVQDVTTSVSAEDVDVRLSTRELWVLGAVATGQVDREPRYGGLCTLDGRSVGSTVVGLALGGLIARCGGRELTHGTAGPPAGCEPPLLSLRPVSCEFGC